MNSKNLPDPYSYNLGRNIKGQKWARFGMLIFDIKNNDDLKNLFQYGTDQEKKDALVLYDLTEADCYEFKEDLEGATVTIEATWFIL